MESVVVALIPVVPAVVPPLSSFRGRAGATGGDGLSHASRHRACRVARAPRRRGEVPCGETGGSAGRPGCRPARRAAPGWRGAPAPTTRASALGSRPGAAAGDVAGGSRGRDATTPRGRTGGGSPCGRGPDDVGGGATTRAPSALASRPPGRHVRRQPDGSRTGWRECPRRGPAAAATGLSRQCRPLKLMTLPSAPGTSRASCAAPGRMPRGPRSFPGAA